MGVITFRTFLHTSASELGVLNPTQTLSGPQLDVWRQAFNELVKNLSADRLFLHYVPDVTYVGGGASKESYEIGPGGVDFDTTPAVYVRPVFVQSVRAKVGNARRWPLNMRTEQEFSSNPLRGMTDPDGPIDFYYAASIAKGTFNFAPKLLANQTFYVSQWNPLRVFLDTEYGEDIDDFYPDEYIRALRLNLAIAQAPRYQKQIGQEIVGNAQAAIQTIRSLNSMRLGGSVGQSGTHQAPSIGAGQQVAPVQQ